MMEYEPKKYICSCAQVTYGDMVDLFKAGAKTVQDVRARTRATAYCGTCTERVEDFLTLLAKGEAVAKVTETRAPAAEEIPAAVFQRICEDVYQVGTPFGNSYLIRDQQSVLIDLPEDGGSAQLLRNAEALLGEQVPSFLVLTHIAPDQTDALRQVMRRWPKIQVACAPGMKAILRRYLGAEGVRTVQEVRNGISILQGLHILSFHLTGSVAGQPVMAVYERRSETLFSGEIFSADMPMWGGIFADRKDASELRDAGRKAYFRLAGKTDAILSTAQLTEQKPVCQIAPAAGPVWRQEAHTLVERWCDWERGLPEEKGVTVVCASFGGHTAAACRALADALDDEDVKPVRFVDLREQGAEYAAQEILRRSHAVLASVTENGALPEEMKILLSVLRDHGVKDRTFALTENGAWAPCAGAKMREELAGMPVTVLPRILTVHAALTEKQMDEVSALAHDIASSMR